MVRENPNVDIDNRKFNVIFGHNESSDVQWHVVANRDLVGLSPPTSVGDSNFGANIDSGYSGV
jgi:hypothetical protein